jgi:ribonuclease HI
VHRLKEQLAHFEVRHLPREQNREANRLAQKAAKKSAHFHSG